MSKVLETNTTINPLDVVRFAWSMKSYVWPIAQTAFDYGLGRTSAVEESWELETRVRRHSAPFPTAYALEATETAEIGPITNERRIERGY